MLGARTNRRTFIAGFVSAAAGPLAAQAQQFGKVWRIGWISGASAEAVPGLQDAFLQGMRELGYVEGRDFVIEWRFANGNCGRLPELAAELVQLKVDVLLTGASAAIRPLQRATSTIPIVVAYSTDPVGNGFAASLAHPEGNITGLSSASDDTSPKQLELLTTIVPNVSRVGVLENPSTPTYSDMRNGVENAAQKSGFFVVPVEARNPREIDNAFDTFRRERVQVFIAAGDALFFGQRRRIAELALNNRLPSIFSQREYAEVGGLMSYGENLSEFFRRSASFVDKIFKGAKPGDLPIEQPTLFKLVINRRTADALGLKITPQFYVFADEVIE